MTVSAVSICNSALIKVGGDLISSLSQGTKSANLCNAIFTTLRDEVLRAHPWNFAITRATLTPTVNLPEFEYEFEFTIPSDCLRVLEVNDDETKWVVEGRKILCNESPIEVRYVYRNEDPSSWDSMFAEALAWKIASEICYAITQSSERAVKCGEAYKEAIAFARSTDGAEGTLKGFVAETWTNARR